MYAHLLGQIQEQLLLQLPQVMGPVVPNDLV
jgi:hypothetical protein